MGKDASSGRLVPRLEETRDGLLQGLSEKQIALKLGLSEHTVHHYVEDLYRRFGVSSRGEFMARFLPDEGKGGSARRNGGGAQRGGPLDR